MRREWLEPGCHPVIDGVLRIPLDLPGDGLRAVNVYVLETQSGIALIDGGWNRPGTYDELKAGLSAIGRTPDEIHDVFVTHIHRDHYTFAVELRRRHGCRVHLGEAESPGLDMAVSVGSNVPVSVLTHVRRAGAGRLADVVEERTARELFDVRDWEQPDSWLSPGRIDVGGRHLDVEHTPGHTKGHVIFRDPDNELVFTGDHILPTITPSIGFELGDWELPLEKFLHSLRLLDSDDHTVMAPSHGNVGAPIGPRARALLAHHRLRFTEILDVFGVTREYPAVEVARHLEWTRRRRPFDELDAFNQMIAVSETIAHLDVLTARGLVAGVVDDNGVESFRRVPMSDRATAGAVRELT